MLIIHNQSPFYIYDLAGLIPQLISTSPVRLSERSKYHHDGGHVLINNVKIYKQDQNLLLFSYYHGMNLWFLICLILWCIEEFMDNCNLNFQASLSYSWILSKIALKISYLKLKSIVLIFDQLSHKNELNFQDLTCFRPS